jgi:hypothetical protein
MKSRTKLKVGAVLKLSDFHWIRRLDKKTYFSCVINAVGGRIEGRSTSLGDAIEKAKKTNARVLELGRLDVV